ncbi:amino acid permease [Nonomuraea pusilla]|uniref:Amino acid/polyamine/organocation transporter, APC superfamily (TC 2.A.3) n=1 Tax=Nonomuraea pusilla TaxID=46177 RepID=A0A1H7NIV1_9ACTN|nr:amino acid permease [Nonomuraea pusilla]SEL23314.1 amino acid/polyamine/organocation transporter, APC superfamily (TC 2.A.3) [Nonomuraea pusilla]
MGEAPPSDGTLPGGPAATAPRSSRSPAPAGLGFGSAVALVIGNVVGTGIFLLPASLAAIGTVSLVAMVLVTLGAVAMALVFGRLGARMPVSGGPYAYAREAFGEFAGFWISWSFWLTAWIGNAAIAVAWVGYVQYAARHLLGLDWGGTAGSVAVGLAGLSIPAAVNLMGVRNMAAFQTVTAVLKFVPLLLVAVVGLLFFQVRNFPAFNATTGGWVGALSTAGAVTLFIYSGVESVAVAAGKVRDPARTVGRASVAGVLACAALYLLTTVAVMGTVPHERLARSSAPFADALDQMAGGSAGGVVIALCAVVSGLGALNGWTLLVAEMPMAAARHGMFPPAFARTSARGAPYVGVLAGTALTSLMLLVGYASSDSFRTIVLLASFTTVIPYFFSAAAQVLWLATGTRAVAGARLARDLLVALLALLFSFWMAYGSGADAVLGGVLMLLAGVPVYIWLKARRGECGPRDSRLVEGIDTG